MLKFTIFYLFNMLFMFLLFFYQTSVDFQLIYTNFVNSVLVSTLNGFGIYAIHSGINILLQTSILVVKFGCNGLEAVLIFTAALLSYGAEWRLKLVWLLKGIAILMIVNFFRLLLLAYILENYREHFNFMHDYVTQDIMIFIAIMLFFLFTQQSLKNVRSRNELLKTD